MLGGSSHKTSISKMEGSSVGGGGNRLKGTSYSNLRQATIDEQLIAALTGSTKSAKYEQHNKR